MSKESTDVRGTLEQLLALERATLVPLRQAIARAWVDEADPERAMVAAWKRVYERPEHSRTAGSGRRAAGLWHKRQADLCDIVRLALEVEAAGGPQGLRAERLRKEAQTAFLFANDGYLHSEFVRRFGFQGAFESEDADSAKALILQEAREGLIDGMRRYDRNHAKGANALTYCGNWARQRVFKALEQHGRVIPYKHAESNRRKIVKAIRALEDAGLPVNVAQIADTVGISADDVLMLLPNIGPVSRLDAPVREGVSDGESLTVGASISDGTVDIEGNLERSAMIAAVQRAVSDISDPMQRAVIEMLKGLGGREACAQAALFDGVYVDAQGNQFAAKPSICTAPHRLGDDGEVVVQLRAQSELSQALRAGQVQFVPGTPQAAELVRIAHTMGRGPWAPSSGSVQDAFVRAEACVRESEHLRPWAKELRSRGNDEIENSEQALCEVRDGLVALGVCSEAEAQRLKAGSLSGEGKKGSARVLGEAHGLIDAQTGRLTSKLRALLTERTGTSHERKLPA